MVVTTTMMITTLCMCFKNGNEFSYFLQVWTTFTAGNLQQADISVNKVTIKILEGSQGPPPYVQFLATPWR